MNYNVIATSRFKRDIKKLVKKYSSLRNEYADLLKELKSNPEKGVALGNNCYKLRIAIASKGKGKSGGARVITFVVIKENVVFLLTIFDKSEKENITDKELDELLNQVIDQ